MKKKIFPKSKTLKIEDTQNNCVFDFSERRNIFGKNSKMRRFVFICALIILFSPPVTAWQPQSPIHSAKAPRPSGVVAASLPSSCSAVVVATSTAVATTTTATTTATAAPSTDPESLLFYAYILFSFAAGFKEIASRVLGAEAESDD